jgi:hypothetical protein
MANDFKIRKGLIVLGSGSSTPIDTYGSQGELFSITDSLSGSLFSINDISGIPVIEAFSNNWVNLGTFNREGLKVRGDVVIATGSFSGSFTGSLSGTASFATQTLSSSFAVTASYALNAAAGGGGSAITIADEGTSQGTATFLNFIGTAVTATVSSNTASISIGNTVFNRQTGSYTLISSDVGKLIEMNSGSANILTIPSSSTVNFATGSAIDVVQYGAGQTSIASASIGVTIRSANNWVKINARYGAASLVKVGTDEWYLFGNLNA